MRNRTEKQIERAWAKLDRVLESARRTLEREERRWAAPPPRPPVFQCGAEAKRTGIRCQLIAMENGKCRFHGGLSTGPKTPEGKARALANLRQFRHLGTQKPHLHSFRVTGA